MLLVRDNIVNYYVDKKEILGGVDKNVELVTILNDVLNRLKDAINPMVIVQVYILKYVETGKSVAINVVEKTSIEPEKNISQEIIIDPKSAESANLTHKEEEKTTKKVKKSTKETGVTVNEDIKKIRVNNAMATANIKYKKEFVDIWNKIDDYFMDDKYGKVAQLLSDTTPMVVGTEYLILTATSDGIISNIYASLAQVEDFINKLYHLMRVVVISNDEFNSVKEKYIEDKNNNIVYQIQEECGKLVSENNDLINQAIDLFGADMVEIE